MDIVLDCEKKLNDIFKSLDDNEFYFSKKVLDAFKEENVNVSDFASTTGYGYDDTGRDKIERIYAKIFCGEDALVRSQIISGTHALTTTLFAILRPNDILLSITGKLYDTMDEIIGIRPNNSSLISFGIKYEQIDLINDDFAYDSIVSKLKSSKIKVIDIQRSKGYSTRKSISIDKIKKVINTIRQVDKDVIIMIDNCYCEFVEKTSPLEVGADLIVGSLIKNLGAGICTNGGYIVGRKDLINLAAERLNVPGQGKEIGPSLGFNKDILKGLYFSPMVVKNALKTAILASSVFEELGYKVEPKYNDNRVDIVQNIYLENENDLIEFCKSIQGSSAIDSNASLIPTNMPGYDSKIIMASGSFVSGSSIEISCDGPLKKPYIAYLQGSLSYEYGKLAIINTVNRIKKVY